MSSHDPPSVHVCVLISSNKDTGHIGLEPTHTTSFNLNYLLKDSISKYSLMPRYWGLGLQQFGGQIIQRITLGDYKNGSKSSSFLKNCFNAFGNVTYALVQKMQAIQNGV